MKTKEIIKEIKRHEKAVAKVRDDIDTTISTLEALREDCVDSYDALQEARDALSRTV